MTVTNDSILIFNIPIDGTHYKVIVYPQLTFFTLRPKKFISTIKQIFIFYHTK